MTTGENLTEVIYTAKEINPAFVALFLFMTVVGMFFMTAILVGAFETAFGELENKNIKKAALSARTGAVAAFTLLDVDRSGSLMGDELAEIILAISRNMNVEFSDAQIKQIFTRVDKDFNGVIDIREFVQGVDEVFDMAESVRRAATNVRTLNLLESIWFKSGVVCLLMLDALVISLMGLVPAYDGPFGGMDIFSLGLLVLFSIEVSVRVWVTSPSIFWNYARYKKDGTEDQFANRMHLCLTVIAGLGVIVFGVISSRYDAQYHNWFRFFLALPVGRLLVTNDQSRHLLWCLVLILPMFVDLLIFLLLIFYVFSYWGVWLFHDKFKVLAYEGEGGHPGCDFDSLTNAMITLFQLLVGEAWHEVMYAAVKVTDWSYAYYFVSFSFIVSMLFTNLIVGVILAVFQMAQPMTSPTFRMLVKRRRYDSIQNETKADLGLE